MSARHHDTVITATQTDDEILKNLLRYFAPFCYIETIFFCPKYRIRDVIKPIGMLAIAYCIVGNSIAIVGWYSRAMASDPFLERINQLSIARIAKFCEYLSHMLNYLILMMGFVTNLANTITQRRNIVNLVQIIIKILHKTNIDNVTFSTLIKKNRIYCAIEVVLFLSLYTIINFITSLLSNYKNTFVYFVFDIPLLIFNIHIMYSVSFVVLMRRIAMVIKKTLSSEEDHSTYIYETVYKTYVDLLSAFELYKTVFQDLILYFIFITVFHTLVLIEYTVAQFMTENLSVFPASAMAIFIATFSFKKMFFITLLSEAEERFHDVLEDITVTSHSILRSRQCSVTKRRILKNINRLYRNKFKKTNLRGLLCVDINLPIQVINFITIYVVVILQFNFP